MNRLDQYHIEFQSDGWPKGISKEEKEEMLEIVAKVLNQFPRGVDLSILESRVSYERPAALKGAALWDFRFATIVKAAMSVNGNEVWKPDLSRFRYLHKHESKARVIATSRGESIRNGAKGKGKVLWSIKYDDIPAYTFPQSAARKIQKKKAAMMRQNWMDLHGWRWNDLEDIKQGIIEKVD
jgi:hypothetical protein